MLIAFVMQKSKFEHVSAEVKAEAVQECAQQTTLAKETMILNSVVGTRYMSAND